MKWIYVTACLNGSLFVNVPMTHQALPRCAATDSLDGGTRWTLGRVTQLYCRLCGDKFQSIVSPHSGCFNGEWGEVDAKTMSE